MPEDNKSQGIIRDERGQEQPADKERAQQATLIDEKEKKEEKRPKHGK
ncbi:MAG: hypothetical protein V4517_05155 [Pseudomonadota bacterium]